MDIYQKIYQYVQTIPYGRVTSYGHVAKAVGIYRGARIVGWALRALPEDTSVPWHRVVDQRGIISIINPRISASLQRRRLEAEGVEITEKNSCLSVSPEAWWYSGVN